MAVGVGVKQFIRKLHTQFNRLGKLKYALITVLLGILFLLPVKKENSAAPVMNPTEPEAGEEMVDIEAKMSRILSSVQGAGEVSVMLTIKNSGETEYQTDTENYANGEQTEVRSETVFSSSTNGEAVIRKQNAPEYLGALVISQGADSAEVCLNLTKAVCSLTGLSSNRVTVLKME